MITLNNIAVGNDWEWIFWALFPQDKVLKYMSQVQTFQFTRTHFPFTRTHTKCVKNTLILMPGLHVVFYLLNSIKL